MKRIGVAFTFPSAIRGVVCEYGIVRLDSGGLAIRFEGTRTQTESGEVQTGLPLSGPMASWAQPLRDFDPAEFETVRYFDPAFPMPDSEVNRPCTQCTSPSFDRGDKRCERHGRIIDTSGGT